MHPQCRRAHSDRRADCAEPDDADPLAGKAARKRKRTVQPVAAQQERIAVIHAAKAVDQLRDREVRNVVGDDAGRVRHADATLARSGTVDRVEPDPEAGDQFQPREVLEQRSLCPPDAVRDDRPHATPRRRVQVRGAALAQVQRVVPIRKCLQFRRQAKGDEQFRLHS